MSQTCQHHTQCLETALAQAEQLCAANGARLTTIRKRVLALIWAGHEPVKAYDLLAKLQQDDASAKPPTVYRALDFLLEQKLIHKLHSLNAYVGCSHPGEETPCLFMICQNCHHVTEAHDEGYRELLSTLCQSQQFAPQTSTFEIEGLCQQCA